MKKTSEEKVFDQILIEPITEADMKKYNVSKGIEVSDELQKQILEVVSQQQEGKVYTVEI